jgi:hypothetical protein
MRSRLSFVSGPLVLLVLTAWTGSQGGCSADADNKDGGSSLPMPSTGGAVSTGTGTGGSGTSKLDKFSFFVASFAAMQRLSKSPNGFGGDLRYGEADGLSGADKICTEIAETSMAGSGAKGWKAFLSVVHGPKGTPVNAIERIGAGPWYDRLGRAVAIDIAGLLTARPTGGDPEIAEDLPNEDGVKNQAPDGMAVDNHDTLTGTNSTGKLFSTDPKFTCKDWTSAVGSDGTPRVGHSWSRFGSGGGFPGFPGDGGFPTGIPGFPGDGGFPPGFPGDGGFPPGFPGDGGFPPGFPRGDLAAADAADYGGWKSALTEAGCAPGASLVEMGAPILSNPTVGSGGGYGGIFCFALKP